VHCFVSIIVFGWLICIDEQLHPIRGRSGFRQYMSKKPSKNGINIWMMCVCGTKYMMNAKVYMGKENNEVVRGLAGDVVFILVQPFLVRTEAGEM